MSTSGGSGYCDCGDADAWKQGFACNLHKVDEKSQEENLHTSVTWLHSNGNAHIMIHILYISITFFAVLSYFPLAYCERVDFVQKQYCAPRLLSVL